MTKKEAAEKAERDAKTKREADAIRAKEAAEAVRQEKRLEEQRAERERKADEEIEREARALFFAGSPGASEAVYKSVRDEYRKLVLLRRSENAPRRVHSVYKW